MSLLSKSISGIKWTTVSYISVSLFQFAQICILAHLLTPQDFGLMAMVTVVSGFVNRFSDMGISNAVIHKKDLKASHLKSLFWVNIVAGCVLSCIVSLCASLLAVLFNEPSLIGLIFWISLSFGITSFGQLTQALLQKKLLFKQLAVIDMASIFIGCTASVLFASANYGVLSMVFGVLITCLVKSILLIGIGKSFWLPGFHFSISDIKPYISFGLFQIGEKAVNYIGANMDYILIGRYLGADILGVYRLAYELVVMPMQKLNPVLTTVAFPVFALKQDDNALLRQGYLSMIKVIAFISSPLLIGLAVVSPVFIPIFFGEGWGTSIALVKILACLGLVKAVFNPCGTVFLAKGRADIGFYLNFVILCLNTLLFYFAVKSGVNAVAWCFLSLTLIYSAVILKILNYLIGITRKEFFSAVFSPLGIGIIMGLITLGFQSFLRAHIPQQYLLMATVSIGALSYLLSFYLFEKEYLLQLMKHFMKR